MKVFRTAALAVVAAMGLGLMFGDTARADDPPMRSGKNLKIVLKWGNKDDVDLHVVEPDGTPGGHRVYYGDKGPSRNGGHLREDANAEENKATNSPQEVYENPNAPVGKFRIEAHMYRKRINDGATRVTVEVWINGRMQPDLTHETELRGGSTPLTFDIDL